MLIKKIKFPKTNNNFFHKLEGIEFNFLDHANNPAKFIFFIGENGSGKTTLLYWLWQIHELCWTPENNNVKIWKYLCSAQKIQNNADKTTFNDIFLECILGDLNVNLKIIKRDDSLVNFADFKNYFKSTFTMQCLLDKQLHPLIKDHGYNPFVFYRLFTADDYLNNNKKNEIKNDIFDLDDEGKKDMHSYRHLFYKGHIKEPPHILETTFKKINDMVKKCCGYEFTIDYINGASTLFFSKVESGKENKYFFSTMSSGENHLLSLFFKICDVIFRMEVDKIFLFIDEVENSLSPKKQEKILEDLEDLLKISGRKIENQIFVATHSPFILKNFLNRNDTVIINVKTGENILKSEKKKLLLNKNNNVSYDEISYLYYDIPTSNYYISLYETMKRKFKENIGNKLLIASKLSCLYDDTYTDWNSFVEKFKDENWRNDQKNKPIVEQLCKLLSCQPDETHDKINGLSNKIKSYATILRNEKHNTTCGLNALKKMTDDGLCFFYYILILKY